MRLAILLPATSRPGQAGAELVRFGISVWHEMAPLYALRWRCVDSANFSVSRCHSFCCSCFSFSSATASPRPLSRHPFLDFAAKLRMRMQQTAFLLWPFAIVPPMCCQFGAQPGPALATVAASYAGFLVSPPLSLSLFLPLSVFLFCAAAPSAWTMQRFAIALQITRLNVRRLPAAKAGSSGQQRAASKPKIL